MVRRRQRGSPGGVTITAPMQLAVHNLAAHGVDRCDQRMAKHNTAWKSRRWYINAFFFALNVAVANATILFERFATRNRDFTSDQVIHFMAIESFARNYHASCRQLLPKLLSFKQGLTRTLSTLSKGILVQFHSESLDELEHELPGPHHLILVVGYQRKCNHSGCQKRPSSMCQTCDVHLCPKCFAPFHARLLHSRLDTRHKPVTGQERRHE